MNDIIIQFIEAMRAAGFEPARPSDIVECAGNPPGRFHCAGDKPGSKNGAYTLHLDEPVRGWFQNHKLGVEQTWKPDLKPLSPEEKRRFRAEMDAKRAEREKAIAETRARAAAECEEIWNTSSKPDAGHPYLERKGVGAHALRLVGDRLVVPVTKNRELVGLQYISPTGEKLFHPGSDISGAYAVLGKPENELLIAEGYATAATLFEITGIPVAIAFNAGNLLPVARTMRERLPDARIVICADDDRFTDTPIENPGVHYATHAARAIAAEVSRPFFRLTSKGTDFNDLAIEYGNDEVRFQISNRRASWTEPPNPEPPKPVDDGPLFHLAPSEVGYMTSHSQVSGVLANAVRDRLIYDADMGHWYQFRDIWQRKDSAVIKRQLLDFLDEVKVQGCSTSFFMGVFKMLEVRISRSETASRDLGQSYWNETRNLIPLENGVLNIETKELLPHSPDLMFNWSLPHRYDPTAQCPSIDRLLLNIAQDDEGHLQILEAYLAAIFYGMPELQKYLEIVGKPGTGKSTFMKIATELVGGRNVISTTFENLEKNRFETASLYGKRLAIIPDADQWSGSFEVFKSITGQDPIRFEEKNIQQSKPFIYKGMVIVSANAPVSSSDLSTAMMRRRIPIHIDKRLDRSKIDPTLDQKIRKEIPGLINRLLAMDVEEVKQTLRAKTLNGQLAERRALVDTNSVADWVENCCIIDFTSRVKIGLVERERGQVSNANSALYPNYCAYTEATGRRIPVSLKRFSNAVLEICEACDIPLEKIRNNGSMIVGLRLRRTDDSGSLMDRSIPTPIMNQKSID